METHLKLDIGKTIIITSEKQLFIKIGDEVCFEFEKEDPNYDYFSNLKLKVVDIWEQISGINEIKNK